MWSLVIMFFYKLTFLLFGVLYTTYGDTSSSSSSSELKKKGSDDDDNKLKQALLLVDMLKSESNVSSPLEPGRVSLLPATSATPPHPTMDPNATLDAKKAQHTPSPAPLALNNSSRGQVLGKVPGRRMMNPMHGDIRNNNTNFRRNMDAGDPTLDSTNISLSITQKNQSSINSTLSAPTKKMSHKFKVTPHANKDMDAKLGVAATAPSHKIKDFFKNLNESNIKDPLMDQIASELTYELRDDRHGIGRAKSTISENTTETSPKSTTTALPVKRAWPSTINIWLSKSSKMEFPLSPQVALCVLSPRNALCKTQI